MSKQFVNYAQSLPLAIEVLGCFLFNRSKEEWQSVLDRLKDFPVEEIKKILKISFDGLPRVEKEIFLHIACFFNMKDTNYVVEILDCLGLHPNTQGTGLSFALCHSSIGTTHTKKKKVPS